MTEDRGQRTEDGRPGGIDAGDVVGMLGLLMVGAGLAAWDWRVALVVVGAILVLLAVVGAVRAGGK